MLDKNSNTELYNDSRTFHYFKTRSHQATHSDPELGMLHVPQNE